MDKCTVIKTSKVSISSLRGDGPTSQQQYLEMRAVFNCARDVTLPPLMKGDPNTRVEINLFILIHVGSQNGHIKQITGIHHLLKILNHAKTTFFKQKHGVIASDHTFSIVVEWHN